MFSHYVLTEKKLKKDAKIVLHLHGLGIVPSVFEKLVFKMQITAIKKSDIILVNADRESIDEFAKKYFPDRVNDFYQEVSPVDMKKFIPSPDRAAEIASYRENARGSVERADIPNVADTIARIINEREIL